MSNKSTPVGFRMPNDLFDRVLNYQARKYYTTFSQSIISLIGLGLEHPEASDFRVSKEKLKQIREILGEPGNANTDIRGDH